MDHERRVRKLREKTAAAGLDAVLVTNMTNVRYLCGFTGSNGYLMIGQGEANFITDGRYKSQAGEQVQGADVTIYLSEAELGASLKNAATRLKSGRLGFESSHVTVTKSHLSGDGHTSLEELGAHLEGTSLVETAGWVEELRMTKDADEMDAMRSAAEMADAGFRYIIDRIEVGKTETEIALDLEFFLRSNGAEAVSFEPIVASGERSALPHARPTDRQIEKSGYLLFDLGCVYQGYCSDLTRTVVIGPVTDRHREVYDSVLKAQELALRGLKPGITGRQADALARDTLTEWGLGETFIHGLGHGVGLEIHENPRLNKTSETVLQQGYAVTVEPGSYEQGWGGVRIEDLVVLVDDGAEVLSSASKELIVV